MAATRPREDLLHDLLAAADAAGATTDDPYQHIASLESLVLDLWAELHTVDEVAGRRVAKHWLAKGRR